MKDDIQRVAESDLRALAVAKLIQAGVAADDAAVVSDVLVYADLRGVHSHGVLRVEHYINRIRAGGINLRPVLEFQNRSQSVGLLDAQGGLGHVTTRAATRQAMEMARREGIALVGIKNNSHCGALAYFVQMALDATMTAMVAANTDIRVVPYGGRDAYFGTNPLAFGFPGRREHILLDMATSDIAWGKVLTARKSGAALKDGCAVDGEGRPTTDPHAAVNLLPFGGVKGYGISIMVEALTGLLIGGVFGPYLNRMYEDVQTYRNLSNFILIVDPAAFDPGMAFLDNTQRMIDELHAMPPAPGNKRVLIPGEIERMTMEGYRVEGIPIPSTLYRYLTS